MQVVTAVFLKQGVPQPSYAVLIRWGGNIRWVYRYEAEVDLYKSIPSYWILNSDSGIITMSVLLNKSKIFHCRIGAMMEE